LVLGIRFRGNMVKICLVLGIRFRGRTWDTRPVLFGPSALPLKFIEKFDTSKNGLSG
jgi:hypothetical protein